jgi:hypothetical protein
MEYLITILRLLAILIAAVIIGRTFLGRAKRARTQGAPWYTPYLSLPGLLIVLVLLLPVIVWLIRKAQE